jgi:uroporphyrinogen-III synthase
MSPDTPAAVVCDAGGEQERVIRTTLAGLAAAAASAPAGAAGLLIVGAVCRYGRERRRGALRGLRVLLTCSDALMDRAAMWVTDFGGVPIPRPLIELVARPDAVETIRNIHRYDWVVLTSPSSVRSFMESARRAALDLRGVPRLMVCGAGTSDALRREGFTADAVTADSFGSDGMLETARSVLHKGDLVLRLRSAKAGTGLAEALQAFGATVTDCVLYDNQPVRYDSLPEFDAVFFASASAVESFLTLGTVESLNDSIVLAIGQPTAAALERAGRAPDVVANPATVQGAIESLARYVVGRKLSEEDCFPTKDQVKTYP